MRAGVCGLVCVLALVVAPIGEATKRETTYSACNLTTIYPPTVLGRCGTSRVALVGSRSLLVGRLGTASMAVSLYPYLVSGHIGATRFLYARSGSVFGGHFGSSRIAATIVYGGSIAGAVNGYRSTCIATGDWYFCRGSQVEALVPLAALLLARS
jgi:hypothetical protein